MKYAKKKNAKKKCEECKEECKVGCKEKCKTGGRRMIIVIIIHQNFVTSLPLEIISSTTFKYAHIIRWLSMEFLNCIGSEFVLYQSVIISVQHNSNNNINDDNNETRK